MKRKQMLVLWAAALLPLVMVALAWAKLPAQVPIHWNLEGSVDRYAGRAVLWLLAALNAVIVLLMGVFPKADPKRDNYRKFQSSYNSFRLLFALFMDAIMLITLVEALRPGSVGVGKFVQVMAGLLLAVVGNMMPEFRQTFFCGIRNAWTLSSEQVWAKTHRLSGRMFFAAGLLNIPGAFLPAPWNFTVLMVSVLASGFIPLGMSYLWFRQEQSA